MTYVHVFLTDARARHGWEIVFPLFICKGGFPCRPPCPPSPVSVQDFGLSVWASAMRPGHEECVFQNRRARLSGKIRADHLVHCHRYLFCLWG